MSSCINKKTVHKQGARWAHQIFKTSGINLHKFLIFFIKKCHHKTTIMGSNHVKYNVNCSLVNQKLNHEIMTENQTN